MLNNVIAGQHANPRHTIEDMWFLVEASDLLEEPSMIATITAIAKHALEIGWNEEYGGILHYCGVNGGEPKGELLANTEPMERQVLDGWGDKLWWIHAEALYTTVLCYAHTSEESFLEWHEKVFEYTFRVFPNRHPQIREWKQICKRDGKPQDKVVALPVKDPLHITRTLIMILELLESMVPST